VTEAVWAAALVAGRAEDPGAALFQTLFAARCVTLLALAAALVAILLRARAIRTAVARVVDQLDGAPAPGSLSAAIGRVVGDRSLTVAYWLASAGHNVDADGRRVDVGTGNGHTVTPIVRGDSAVAVVVHDAPAGDGQELVREIGAAALLAVDNERLVAETRAQLAELSASRARIVTTADRERRRLERDLHDGAQQQLLALSYDLRMARARAEQAGDASRGAGLAAALGQAEAALDELRELAHGIYPAVLEESGLEPALKTLANRAPIAVELELDLRGRAAPECERAAYVLVVAAIVDAVQRAATFVEVAAIRAEGLLRVRAHDDGAPRQARLAHVGDRVGALRGSTEFGPTTIEAEIPCA
jgi:signal transduction histidine kinase